jgi:hypothetical protein
MYFSKNKEELRTTRTATNRESMYEKNIRRKKRNSMITSDGLIKAIYRLEAKVGRVKAEKFLRSIEYNKYERMIQLIDKHIQYETDNERDTKHRQTISEGEATNVGIRRIVKKGTE